MAVVHVVEVAAAEAERVADELWAAGATAIEERPGRAAGVVVLVSDVALPGSEARTVDGAAIESWRDHAQPVRAGDGLVVVPAWWAGPVPAGAVVVRIEPGATFGSGAHATTRLCLAALERLAGPGRRVLDVGSGSGVLSVVAARLGAAVTAIDIDAAAAAATAANAAANGVEELVAASTAPLSAVPGPFDVICANVLAPVLIELAPALVPRLAPGGRLVVSGLLERRWAAVAVALAPLRVVRTTSLDGWVALELAQS